jgi:hypothetical protein
LVTFKFDQNIRNDSEPIFKLESAEFSLINNDELLSKLREDNNKLCLKMNRTINLSAEVARMHFPFNYRFNDTFEHVIATFKMVKKMYKPHSEPFHPDSKLPPDLRFKFEKLIWTIEDDPFEGKVKKIYESTNDYFYI